MTKINNFQLQEALQIAYKNIDNDEDPFKGIKGLEKLPFLKTYYKKLVSVLNKLFKQQQKHYTTGIIGFKASGSSKEGIFRNIIGFINNKLIPKDKFRKLAEEQFKDVLERVLMQSTEVIMDDIDETIQFDGRISKDTDKRINKQASTVAKLMDLATQNTLKKTIKKAIQGKLTLEEAIEIIRHLPHFDRKRAQRVAITEILTAVSAAQQEAAIQSPAVTGKQWQHVSVTNPRHTHEEYDGTIVGVADYFSVGGEKCLYPRDLSLSAGNRVNCKCQLQFVIDLSIKDGLDKLEKEKLREIRLRKGLKL